MQERSSIPNRENIELSLALKALQVPMNPDIHPIPKLLSKADKQERSNKWYNCVKGLFVNQRKFADILKFSMLQFIEKFAAESAMTISTRTNHAC